MHLNFIWKTEIMFQPLVSPQLPSIARTEPGPSQQPECSIRTSCRCGRNPGTLAIPLLPKVCISREQESRMEPGFESKNCDVGSRGPKQCHMGAPNASPGTVTFPLLRVPKAHLCSSPLPTLPASTSHFSLVCVVKLHLTLQPYHFSGFSSLQNPVS